MDVVSVPKTPVHKDASPILPQHQVRMSGQSFMVQSIAKSLSPQIMPHHHLRLSILSVNGSHIIVMQEIR